MDERQNKTRRDAHDRVLDAKIGSLAGGATDDYLEALRQELRTWIALVDEEMATRIARADRAGRECRSCGDTLTASAPDHGTCGICDVAEPECHCCGGPRTEHERSLQWACADCRTERAGRE